MLREGDAVRFTTENVVGEGLTLPVNYDRLPAEVRPGGRVFINDGLIELTVLKVDGDLRGFDAKVVSGGEASTHKGVNAPGASLSVRPPTEQDVKGIEFGVQAGIDWFAASFIRSRGDVEAVKEAVDAADGDQPVISKIEHGEAITNIDEIISASDGVMVARGDLGIEVPPWEVPLLQKRIIAKCNEAGKPVIVATQMLESMVENPRPTRAEASDVANAILDGADAVMLSAESASGQHPIEAVAMMDRIIREVEKDPYYRKLVDANHLPPQATSADAICAALRDAAHTVSAKATITYTSSGFSSMRAARERPEAPILSLTPNASTARRLALVWGVHSVWTNETTDINTMTELACKTALHEGFARPGDNVVIAAGVPFGQPGTTNMLRIAKIWANGAPAAPGARAEGSPGRAGE